MKKCEKCDKSYDTEYMYCPDCGEKTIDVLKCKKCGEELKDGEVYCPFCGTAQSSEAHTKDSASPQGSDNNDDEKAGGLRYEIAVIVIGLLFLLAASGWGVTLYLNQQIKYSNQEIYDLEERLGTEIAETNSMRNEYAFFHSKAAIVPNDKTHYYHHYGCPALGNSSFWIYNVEAAEGKGYDPCPRCWD